MMVRSKIFAILAVLHLGTPALGDDEVVPIPNEGIDEKGFATLKPVTKMDRTQACKMFEGKYIGYYGKVYLVRNCRRHLLSTRDALWKLSRDNKLVVEVENATIAALDLGPPIDEAEGLSTIQNCKSLNDQYLTADFVNVFYMKGCKLYGFPDWETFVAHRQDNGHVRDPIVAVTGQALQRYGAVKEFPSTIDAEIKKLLDATADVDVIPIDEACAGVEGQYVSYYSRIYRIEKCRKREVEATEALIKFRGELRPKELTSEQWISLPDGKPLEL